MWELQTPSNLSSDDNKTERPKRYGFYLTFIAQNKLGLCSGDTLKVSAKSKYKLIENLQVNKKDFGAKINPWAIFE